MAFFSQYRFNGEVLKMVLEHEGINEVYDYEYDHLGRKTSFKHTKGGTLKNVSKYDFDEIGRLKSKKLSPINSIGSVASGSWNNTNTWQNNGLPSINDYIKINAGHSVTINSGEAGSAGSLFNEGTLNTYGQLKLGVLPPSSGGATELQTVDYSYHIRGGLKGINLDASGNLTNKLFSMKLGYEDANFFDGNIGKQEWKSSIDNKKRSFTYTYDGASRIKSGLYESDNVVENYSLNNVNYDFNGGITNLSRNGWRSNNTFGLVDNLAYTYNSNSNKILKVDDQSNETASFTDASGNDYTYNLDGSLTSDANKGISVIDYNYLKKPKKITFSNNQTIEYQYDATGRKLREKAKDGTWTDYFGNLVFKANTLYQIGIDEGRINAQNEYEYAIQDHLGNVRVMFRDSLGVAKITQTENFGVWGESLSKLNYNRNATSKQQFVYTGHERNEELEVYDAKARVYDPIVPRFWQIDPLAEISRRWSPYNYTYNNPIRFIDPDGMSVTETDFSTHYEGEDAQNAFRELKDKDKGKPLASFKTGSFEGPDGDRIRTPLPNVTGDVESEASARSSFVNNFNRGTLFALTNNGEMLLNHFLSGDGSPINFTNNSGMARLISSNNSFQGFVRMFGEVVLDYFSKNNTLTGFRGRETIEFLKPQYLGGLLGDNLFSWTVMGGYQYLQVDITSISKNNVGLTIKVGDIFGAGRGDADSSLPGLSEMYNLQHNYSSGNKYNPFPWAVQIITNHSKMPKIIESKQ